MLSGSVMSYSFVARQAPLSMEFSRQARIPASSVISYSRGSSQPGGRTHSLLRLLYWQADSLPLSHLVGFSQHCFPEESSGVPAYTSRGPLSSVYPSQQQPTGAGDVTWDAGLLVGPGVGALVHPQSQANQDLRELAPWWAQEKLAPCNDLAFPLPYRGASRASLGLRG